MPGHKFTGYYFQYPSEEKHLGLVSTIADDPPMLNWIFVDKDNNLLRHGGRQETLGGHVIGPWYWTDDEEWLTLDKDDSHFVAVLLPNDKWSIAWDRDGRIRESGEDVSRRSETEQDESSSEDEDSEDSSSESSEEEEESEENHRRRNQKTREGNRRGSGSGGGGGLKWIPIRLHRQLQLGMKSQYVKGEKGGEGGGESGAKQ